MLMNGKLILNLPSPVQEIEHPLFDEKNVRVYIKRDDLIHPMISGNKWRKLKHNIAKAGAKDLLTFGGAFSNHIVASAAACNYFGKNSIGIIRGDKIIPLNPSLEFAHAHGMKLDFISRSEYKEKGDLHFLKKINEKYNSPFIVPEGGANSFGIKGCQELVGEIDQAFDYIISAVGTGATVAGIASGLNKEQKVIGVSVLKGANSLLNEIRDLLLIENSIINTDEIMSSLDLRHEYHFGGYAKIKDELIDFMRFFYTEFGIKTDPVYSGKSLFALFDLLKKDYFAKGSSIVYYHCGGLQGIEGMEKRYDIKIY